MLLRRTKQRGSLQDHLNQQIGINNSRGKAISYYLVTENEDQLVFSRDNQLVYSESILS